MLRNVILSSMFNNCYIFRPVICENVSYVNLSTFSYDSRSRHGKAINNLVVTLIKFCR
jgi:hypothetical protein